MNDLISNALGLEVSNTSSANVATQTSNNTVQTGQYNISPGVPVKSVTTTKIPTDEDDQEEDYKKTRQSFEAILKHGQAAMEDLKTLAEDANTIRDAARAYEVMAGIIKSMTDATEKMYDIHEKKKELKGGSSKQPVTNNIDKAVFVGTTEDLVRQIKENSKTINNE